MPRFRITSLIVLVALIAGGLGAMRIGSETLAKSFATLLVVAMLIGLGGALILRKAAWIGFTVFIVGYAGPLSVNRSGEDFGELAIKNIAEGVNPNMIRRPAPPALRSPFLDDILSSQRLNDDLELEAMNDRSFLRLDFEDKAHSQTDPELKSFQRYQTQLRTYHAQAKLSRPRLKNAITIGNACLALTLGWVGAIVGRSLEKRRLSSPPFRPLDLESTTTP